MKKKIIVFIIICVICALGIGGYLLLKNKDYTSSVTINSNVTNANSEVST